MAGAERSTRSSSSATTVSGESRPTSGSGRGLASSSAGACVTKSGILHRGTRTSSPCPLQSARSCGLLSAIRVQLRLFVLVLAPVGDARAFQIVDNSPMTIEMLGRMRGEVDPEDMGRLARCCTHARLPQTPAAAGYRYYDLGGAAPSFYLRRFRLGTRTAAVSLIAPVELSSGLDAER